MPRAGTTESGNVVEQFLEEARHVVQLERHPGIVPVYDVGRAGDVCYIVSQYIDGPTLAQQLKRARPSIEESVRLVATLADIVHFAHSRSWVHRDIKPSNILLDQDGEPHLTDFGLAIPLNELRGRDARPTGTPYYIAPEIVQGVVPAVTRHGGVTRADHRADIYSLGVVLYQLLTGRLPFEADSVRALFEMVVRISASPPRLLNPEVPRELEEVCMQAMARDPDARYRTAADFRDALRAALKGRASDPGATTGTTPTSPAPWPWIAAAAIAIVLAVFAFYSIGRRGGEPSGPAAAPAPQTDTVETLRVVKEILGEQQKQFERQAAELPVTAQPRAGSPAPRDTDAAKAQALRNLLLPPAFAGLERELNEARDAGDEKKEFGLLLKATNDLIDAGLYKQAIEAAERMVELAGSEMSRRPIALGQLGLAQYRLGRADEAIASYQESMTIYRKLYAQMLRYPDSESVRASQSHMARMIGLTLNRIGNANKFLERYQKAADAHLEARALLEKYADRKSELLTTLMNLGTVESIRGKHGEALAILQQGLELARELSEHDSEWEILINLANAQSRSGDNAAAIQSYKAAYSLMGPEATYEARTALLCSWITTLVEEGETDDAMPLLRQLQRIARENDEKSQRFIELLKPLLKSTDASASPRVSGPPPGEQNEGPRERR